MSVAARENPSKIDTKARQLPCVRDLLNPWKPSVLALDPPPLLTIVWRVGPFAYRSGGRRRGRAARNGDAGPRGPRGATVTSMSVGGPWRRA